MFTWWHVHCFNPLYVRPEGLTLISPHSRPEPASLSFGLPCWGRFTSIICMILFFFLFFPSEAVHLTSGVFFSPGTLRFFPAFAHIRECHRSGLPVRFWVFVFSLFGLSSIAFFVINLSPLHSGWFAFAVVSLPVRLGLSPGRPGGPVFCAPFPFFFPFSSFLFVACALKVTLYL